MRSFLKAHLDFLISDCHLSGGVDQIAKEVSALGGFIAVANTLSQQSVEVLAMSVSCRSQSTIKSRAERLSWLVNSKVGSSWPRSVIWAMQVSSACLLLFRGSISSWRTCSHSPIGPYSTNSNRSVVEADLRH